MTIWRYRRPAPALSLVTSGLEAVLRCLEGPPRPAVLPAATQRRLCTWSLLSTHLQCCPLRLWHCTMSTLVSSQETGMCHFGLELVFAHAGSWQDGDGQPEGLGGKVQLQVPNCRVPCEGLNSAAVINVSEQM